MRRARRMVGVIELSGPEKLQSSVVKKQLFWKKTTQADRR
jgi:hypothetical protein